MIPGGPSVSSNLQLRRKQANGGERQVRTPWREAKLNFRVHSEAQEATPRNKKGEREAMGNFNALESIETRRAPEVARLAASADGRKGSGFPAMPPTRFSLGRRSSPGLCSQLPAVAFSNGAGRHKRTKQAPGCCFQASLWKRLRNARAREFRKHRKALALFGDTPCGIFWGVCSVI